MTNEMQVVKNRRLKKIILFTLFAVVGYSVAQAQVSTVEFGKNRIQTRKLKWNYYQTSNFNSYFYQNGQEIAKYVLQIAEKELPDLEKFTEFRLQRRANIVIYNTFDDYQRSNIGLGNDWQVPGGITKLVNNKMVVYFNSNHNDLRRQIREGLAQILMQNLLFGEDVGEFASNQALLDLPQWLTDGYIEYAAENWSTVLDDDLKSEILSEKYKNFYQFAYDKPLLAGHAFWYYIEEKYKKENVTYMLYLARVYKNLNRATEQIAKKKFKEVLRDFMEYQAEKYEKDIARRKNYPKGSEITNVEIGKRKDFFHFNVNPNKRNSSFAVVQYKKGQYKLILNEDDNDKVLLKFGIRANLNEINPNYPLMAWDPKGTRLSVVYMEEGKIKLFVFDVVTRLKPYKRDLTNYFDQVQDMQYMMNSKTLLFSAVKNGHTDIFTYDIENDKMKQITNDVFDNLDASFVAFPNKTGIIFASNRPSATARSADTSLPSTKFNIFLITNFGDKPELNQITQLTKLKFGNGRFPMQYNTSHFTFVNDENGIGNRYAGFFSTAGAGLDTLVLIGNDILRNPSQRDIDSSLRANKKTVVDSVAVVSVTSDTAYVFPVTNYASSLRETRVAGENNQVSEVTREGDEKILYKLKINEDALRRRNVSATPTTYMKRLIEADRLARGQSTNALPSTDTTKANDIFQNEFDKDTTAAANKPIFSSPGQAEANDVLSTAKLYPYKPAKFSADYLVTGFNNSVLVNKYQPYTGGTGPIKLTSNTPLNGMIRIGTSDVFEDYKVSGGFRLSTNLKDNDWMFQFQNMRRRWDWGLTYYRTVQSQSVSVPVTDGTNNFLAGLPSKLISNLYQFNISYPFDVARSLRLNIGVRSDKTVLKADPDLHYISDFYPDVTRHYLVTHLEYIYDNTLNPEMNIWNGLRYNAYIDWNTQVDKEKISQGKSYFNFGFDVRGYYPIYKNFIWAGRAAADFSWGTQKLIYYLGGVENWFMFGDNGKLDENGNVVKFRYFNEANLPAQDQTYAFQTLAVNMRGYIQNAANGNNAVVLNSEFRLPVFTTFLKQPINSSLIRNFQIIQFVDLGTAWNGAYNKLVRPSSIYRNENDYTVQVKVKQPGIGPFLGGYGFGARTTLLGYFLKFDAGWPMLGFFKGSPILYVSMGLDF
jgi:hypothetical protein